MSDSRRWSSDESENMREKIQKIICGRAQRQKCSVTLAPIQCQAMLISHFDLKLLVLAKTHKNE